MGRGSKRWSSMGWGNRSRPRYYTEFTSRLQTMHCRQVSNTDMAEE